MERSKSMLIHGVVVTRNNWGVLALSITNALVNHVDVVHVLNHGSSDQTAHGLNILQEIWGERLKVYTAGSEIPYYQSLLTNMVISLAENDGADWIYVFDSDEFLLPSQNFSLKQELSKFSDNEVGARYSLTNYISTYNFDENILNCYKDLIYKSNPSEVALSPLEARSSVYAGQLTFFDVPFHSKIIFRANKNLQLYSGAHFLKFLLNGQSIKDLISADCAHLSLISKNRLFGKSALGKSHVDMGFSPDKGWQNQLIHQLDTEGKLDWFWQRHSIQTDKRENTNPHYIKDLALVNCLGKSIIVLENKFVSGNLSMLMSTPLKTGCAKETTFSFESAFQMCLSLDKKVNLFLQANKKINIK